MVGIVYSGVCVFVCGIYIWVHVTIVCVGVYIIYRCDMYSTGRHNACDSGSSFSRWRSTALRLLRVFYNWHVDVPVIDAHDWQYVACRSVRSGAMPTVCIGCCVAAHIAPSPIVGGAGMVHASLQQSGWSGVGWQV